MKICFSLIVSFGIENTPKGRLHAQQQTEQTNEHTSIFVDSFFHIALFGHFIVLLIFCLCCMVSWRKKIRSPKQTKHQKEVQTVPANAEGGFLKDKASCSNPNNKTENSFMGSKELE